MSCSVSQLIVNCYKMIILRLIKGCEYTYLFIRVPTYYTRGYRDGLTFIRQVYLPGFIVTLSNPFISLCSIFINVYNMYMC